MRLLCPVCGRQLTRKENTAVCENRHSFDYARQGYVNLLISQTKDHGDNKAMVLARTSFLNTGAYAFLKETIAEEVQKAAPSVLCDLGCGEGYYTAALPCPEKYGFDLSRDALKHASSHDKSTQYCIAGIFHLPVMDECCDFALTCFAPFAKEEVQRILKKDGLFLFVTPGPDHLMELKSLLYEHPYQNAVEPLDTELSLQKEYTITQAFHADHDALMNLFQMTPYAYRTGKEGKEKLEKQPGMDLTAQFVIRIFRK